MSTARKLLLPYDKYQILFDQASDAIFSVQGNGSFDEVNQAVEELTGYLKDELKELNVQALFPVAEKHHIPARSRPLTKEMFMFPGTYEDVAIVRKDGYIRLVELSVRKLQDPNHALPALSLVILRDVTEKKKLERELITKHQEIKNAYHDLEKVNAELKATQNMLVQAGKMAALGELTTGIAHEINQPLQAIRGFTQEVIAQTKDQASVQDSLGEIVTGVDKIVKIIDQLRTFTRKSVENFESTSVKVAIDNATQLLSRQLASRGIEVVKTYDPATPEVYANPVQLEQVFINLAANARDAIDETKRGNGKIQITTRPQKDFVEVVFEDNGTGMSEVTQAKAFNPFYTTKEVGKGMGLGLSLTYGILTKIHASIVVESAVGKGTKFIIKIPVDFRKLG